MIESLQDFYLNKEEPNKSCLLSLRDIILAQDPFLRETQKYGMPCFCYKNKMFCYLWVDKKTNEPYILMADGNLINHPELEQGDRARMKILRVKPNEDLAIETIQEVLEMALDLYRSGKLKSK